MPTTWKGRIEQRKKQKREAMRELRKERMEFQDYIQKKSKEEGIKIVTFSEALSIMIGMAIEHLGGENV